MSKPHTIQLKILKNLLFVESARYSEIKPDKEMENNQYSFHLDQLIDKGYIEKRENQYCLSFKGKEYANQIDTDFIEITKQAKNSVFVCGVQVTKGQNEFLLITRKKQPFFNCQGFMSGKVKYGETISETAERELFEEANLIGKPYVVSIRHYRVFDEKTDQIIEDKFVYLCRVDTPEGVLQSNDESEFSWVAESKVENFVKRPVESFEAFKSELDEIRDFDGTIKFKEIDYKSNVF